MDNRPIGVFDSGVGGLSILLELQKVLPNESFVYLADQKNNPYGGRTIEEIRDLSEKVIRFLLKKDVKIVVIACNTVSVNALSYLREKFEIPLIAVVPVVKTIAQKSKTKKAAVFSTPATANSEYLTGLIEKFGEGCEIYKIGTSKLEHLVEEGIISGPKVEEAINLSLMPLLAKGVDTIALGCTHYPFLTPEIQRIVGSKISIYDSGGAVARRTSEILNLEHLNSSQKSDDLYYTTGDMVKFQKIAEKLMGKEIENVEKAEL